MKEKYRSKYGQWMEDFLKDQYSKRYKQMKKDGELIEFCQMRENRTIRLVDYLMDQGANSSEAEETALSQMFEMTPEEGEEEFYT